MTKTFTENDLVRFLYGELDKQKSEELQKLLAVDEELQEEFISLSKTLDSLDEVSFSPSERSVSKILEFSKRYQTQSA